MHAGGRPPAFNNADELWNAAQSYIATVTDNKKKIRATISGMAFHLGFESRQSMYDYEKRNEEFSYIIKRLRLFIESCYESNLYGFSPTGAIFALKNMGWKDEITENQVQTITQVQPQVTGTGAPFPKNEGEIK